MGTSHRDRIRIESNETFRKALQELSRKWNVDIHEVAHKAVYEALERERKGDSSINGISKKLDLLLVVTKDIQEEIRA